MSHVEASGLVSRIVIPARLESTRLPRKLLLRETGRTVLEHTYRAAQMARRPASVWVATDHLEIVAETRRFGGEALMTDPAARSGADRVAEVARARPVADIWVNVQGDEPEIAGEHIDAVVRMLEERPEADMATLATPIRSRDQLHDPACVKAVFDASGRALYFSRSPIPHARDWSDDLLLAEPPLFYQHVGLYAYRHEFLSRLACLPPSPLEDCERLEQLRVLSAGGAIVVGVVANAARGIDTEADYRAFVSRHRSRYHVSRGA